MTRRQRDTPLPPKDSELLRRANTRAVCRTRVGRGIGFHERVPRRAGQTRRHIIRRAGWLLGFDDERGTLCIDRRVWAFAKDWELGRELVDCQGLRNSICCNALHLHVGVCLDSRHIEARTPQCAWHKPLPSHDLHPCDA